LSPNEHELQFRQWLEEHAGLLFRVVRSFAAAPPDSDDLLQEILLQVWLSLPGFRQESKATTWLYRVALNTGMAWKRRESKHRTRGGALPIEVEFVDHRPAPDEAHAEREKLERLYEVVRALLPADRALVLLYLDGLSYCDMAEVTGISESNVGVRLNRIKKVLSEKLKAEQGNA
jgi:RNA polymerase sigma-70 factor (ECF subfamily)